MEPVQIERFYLGCLAHASYAVGSEGVAAIIDPQRDVDIYLEAAARKGLWINVYRRLAAINAAFTDRLGNHLT